MARQAAYFVGRKLGHLLAVIVALAFAAPPAGAWTSSSSAFGVDIRIEGDGWGSATREEVETLLQAVADELIDGPNPVFAHPIVVTQGGDAPVALFEPGPAGEPRIRISARDRAWAQYAYQFGHELCHVMAGHTVHASDPARRRHQWFEEALCEAAGLYALRSMAARWRDDAPYPAWEDYAPMLTAYAERLLAEPHRRLPAGESPAHWLSTRLQALSDDPYRRADNEVLANLLLQRFEASPEHWAALYALNRDDASGVRDVGHYLRQWREHVPAEHRAFVAELAALFGFGEADPREPPALGPLAASPPATPDS
ncbi:hypothetical protein [Aromatoleum sp.]|uniref:hypothetical protein n=1 Tax=Aromatoleum sp. TaxID=2307007 RepID=UPI002FC98DB0